VLCAMAAAYTLPSALRELPDESQVVFKFPPSLPVASSTAKLTPPSGSRPPSVTGTAAGRGGFTEVKFTREGSMARVEPNDGKVARYALFNSAENMDVQGDVALTYVTIPAAADYGVDAGFLVESWEDGDVIIVQTPPSNYDFAGMASRIRRSSAAVRLMAEAGVLDAFAESTDPVRKVGAAAVATIRKRMSEISPDQEGFRVEVERVKNGAKTYTLRPVWADIFDTTSVTEETNFNA